MRLIPAFEASPKGYADLYQTVLVDTPIGPYFSQFLEQQQERLTNAAQVSKSSSKNVPRFFVAVAGVYLLRIPQQILLQAQKEGTRISFWYVYHTRVVFMR